MFSEKQIISIKRHPDSQLNLTIQTLFLSFDSFYLSLSHFQVEYSIFMLKKM
jgi:hypothetical protein